MNEQVVEINKQTVIQHILKNHHQSPVQESAEAFAPSNIALCKYWGKRNDELNLPTTPSISISLGIWGANTRLSLSDTNKDTIRLNGKPCDGVFSERLINFLNLFRIRDKNQPYFKIETDMNIPMGAGLASSACGFAALVKALDILYGWALPEWQLSILGRLGSGSACRSFSHGFVEWQMGLQTDGMDSFGIALPYIWKTLRVGLWIINSEQKKLSSREGMKRSVLTSPFYSEWPKKHAIDFNRIKKAVADLNFNELGEAAESNALAMHALMLTAWPPIVYSEANTIEAMHKIWALRQQGLSVFFTQDAGANLKLLFLEKDSKIILEAFPQLLVVAPFERF